MMTSEEIWEKMQDGVFIIAEAGKNFIQSEDDRPVSEYLANAKVLVDKAVWAGADAIKFQAQVVEDEIYPIRFESPHAKGIDRHAWVTRNTNATPVAEFWKPLREYCEAKGIVFMATPFSCASALKLTEAGVNLWKIGSADILDFVMLDHLRHSGLPVLMSSGMSTLEDVKKGYDFLRAKNKRVMVMHALSKYPGLPEEANLAVLQLYKEIFPDAPIGFSENSVMIEPSCFAVALGATAVEKHFSLDRTLWGPDHKVSSTPEEFKTMVDSIRAIEMDPEERKRWLEHPDLPKILGPKEKKLKEDEIPLRPLWRKALVAGTDIPQGTVLSKEMIYAMRPQAYIGGLPSEAYESVLGKVTKKAYKKYDPIAFDILT